MSLLYTADHEWISQDNGSAVVGITHHAQDALGDVVFVELPEVGRKLKAGDTCAVVESVKTASDIYSPLSGEITEINQAAVADPALVNRAPYEDGWFFKLKLSNPAELHALLGPEQYTAQISGA